MEDDDDVLIINPPVKKEESDESFEIDSDVDVEEIFREACQEINAKELIRESINETRVRLPKVEFKCKVTDSLFSSLSEQFRSLYSALQVFQESEDARRSQCGISKSSSSTFDHYVPLQERCSSTSSQSGSESHSFSHKTYGGAARRSNDKAEDLEVIAVQKARPAPPKLPPVGNLVRRELKVGMRVYAMKASYFGIWYKAKIVDFKVMGNNEKHYRIKFETRKLMYQTKALSGKHLAYTEPSEVLIPVGTRVIAQYRDEYWAQTYSLYAGIIAEPPKQMNNYRYLVFFDDGYAQYIPHNEINIVCEFSSAVWEDIHPDSREFIKSYLMQYPERPMVKLQAKQIVRTEWNGKWWIAQVVEVDASLAKMYFNADKRTEWIYRGSTRLGPLYHELANAEANKVSGKIRRHNTSLGKKKNAPYVEYTRGVDEPDFFDEDEDDDEIYIEKRQVARKHTSPSPPLRMNVARKSGTLPPVSTKRHTFSSPRLTSAESEGTYEVKTYKKNYIYKPFVPHECSFACVANCDERLDQFLGKNPLIIPLLIGWERHIAKHKSMGKRVVFYRAPCGRRLRMMSEIYEYLTTTNSQLTIDLFCTDSFVHVFEEFVPLKVNCLIKDISYGNENVPVSCINSVNTQFPEYVEYSTRRLPATGVHINLDPEFLICCDCTDNCADKSKCACQNLTIDATTSAPGGIRDEDAGYTYRRLKENIITGIFECNRRCACNSRCLNRVVQNGLRLRLQVFKTEKRGWGLRTLDDIPHGCFICIYAGQLLTEQGANEGGTQFGDEYLAELDYIEVVEKLKEGYESDVMDPDDPVDVERPGGGDTDSSFDAEKEQNSNSSDSDFDVSTEDIAPRRHGTRNKDKVQKLVLRRDTSDGESQQSWMVRNKLQQEEHDESSVVNSAEEEDSQSGFGSAKKQQQQQQAQSPNSKDSASGFSMSKASSFLREPRELDEKTAQDLKNTKLERIPRVQKVICIDSDSEDDSSSKASSSTETRDSNQKQGGSSKVKQLRSLFSSLPDPTKARDGSGKPVEVVEEETEKPQKRMISVRNLSGDQFCYIMDAKSIGNIGRYLNHSCTPNVFVQNVFVDTHDLRFPWVAFFALTYIRAGSELTWDYNYDVGSVPGKVMYCYCSSQECRGRLL